MEVEPCLCKLGERVSVEYIIGEGITLDIFRFGEIGVEPAFTELKRGGEVVNERFDTREERFEEEEDSRAGLVEVVFESSFLSGLGDV